MRKACDLITLSSTAARASCSPSTTSSGSASATRSSSSRRKPTCWPSVAAPRSIGQRRHRDRPAAARLADDQIGGRPRAVEEHLVELGRAGELADRPYLDARLSHRHQQVGQTLVPHRSRCGPGQHEAPVGDVRQRGPHLLPGDHPLVADQPRRGGDAREVGAGAGFGIALAPQFLDGPDPRQEPGPLLGSTQVDQGRPEQVLAEVVHPRGRVGQRVLLMEGDLLVERHPPAAVFDRPGRARPAMGGEVTFPGQPFLERLVLAAGPAEPLELGEGPDEMLGEPPPDLGSGHRHDRRLAYQAVAW